MDSTAVRLHPAARGPALLTPAADLLLIGGLSLAAFAAYYLLIDKGAGTDQLSWTAFYLALLVNNPHFTASYVLRYWDRRLPYDHQLFGPELAMFCLMIFINIHHYFIDNVLWRRDNQALRQYL